MQTLLSVAAQRQMEPAAAVPGHARVMLGLLVAGVVAGTWQAVRATWAEQVTQAALTAETTASEEGP